MRQLALFSAPRGRPRLHRNNAEKQRVYRQRRAAKLASLEAQLAQRLAAGSHTEWSTPPWFFEEIQAEFPCTLDVCATRSNAKCARYFTPDDDGLTQDWGQAVCWMNPPFDRTLPAWMAKASQSAQHGATVVCLVPASTDSQWWQQYALRGEIRYLPRRLKFSGSRHNAPFPCALVIFRPAAAHAAD